MNYLPKLVGIGGVVGVVTGDDVIVIVREGLTVGVTGMVRDTVSAVVVTGGVERVVTVDVIVLGEHVGSAISART